MHDNLNETANKIADIVKSYLVQTQDDRFEPEGRVFLEKQISAFLSAGEPVRFVLPGFPCKSPNIVDKTFGVLPDYGDVISINRLESLAKAIQALYEPGCQVTILSDGTTFNDIVEVPDTTRKEYNQQLRALIQSPYIEWKALGDFLPETRSDDDTRKALIKSAGLPYKGIADFIKRVGNHDELAATHDKVCSYLYNDVRLNRQPQQSNEDYLNSVAEKAYQMMYRGQALSALVERAFPDAIRLSVHQYDNDGPKFTFGFADGLATVRQPWHSVPVLSASGNVSLLGHASVDKDHHVLVTYQGHPWVYVETGDASARKFDYELLKQPLFGLKIDDPQGLGVEALSPAFLAFLSAQFGFVCIKGVQFERSEQLESFCQPFGEIFQWQFGAVHVVKPEEKPSGFVHSLEKTPIHWDLSMIRLDHEQVGGNPWFTAERFMLYCKTPPKKGEGSTTVVDGRIVMDMVGPDVVKKWEDVHITYNTPMTYFGGKPRTYPLVYAHPKTGKKAFRYQEGSDSELQKFTVEVEGVSGQESQAFIEELDRLVYDERCMIAHDWDQGDLLIIDNWQTLHGRLSMTEASRGRELWRVQVF
ncbi:L-tyrosine/L-tryptophan isonitrile synthase family protein [Dickeya dadantii]|uniref:L-tyrosine/L-tryptophan isonitrile synthase family protein n=1 Tax=Dickeya dadantii TaxID=204038 RepID=UPI0003A77103|nr:L-tyrosine/L-tryptophan isonitrile synthase family protein [Dickeya dadantii]